MFANPHRPARVALADPMPGVRDAWRWLLAAHDDLEVAGEAATVAGARVLEADVILCGLRLGDGTPADLAASTRTPVVLWTFLPADERADVPLDGVAAVIQAGDLRHALAPVLREISARSGW